MEFQEKIKAFAELQDLTMPNLAKELDLNYVSMMRNFKENKITTDFLNALTKRYPDIDLNWLFKDNYIPGVSEPGEVYELENPDKLLNEIELIVQKLRKKI